MSTLKGLDPGRLKHRVEILRYTEVEDEDGNSVEALKPLRKVWAEVRPMRGQESLEYYKITNSETYKITMRYTDVTDKDVLHFRGDQFRIQSVIDPLEEHYYLELICVKREDHDTREVSTDG